MNKLRNERGIALVTALLLTLIALAITMALLYLVIWQTTLSGAHKRYKTAIEATQGGAEMFAKQVIPQVFLNVTTGMQASFNLSWNSTNPACLSTKLNNATGSWGAACTAETAATLFDATKNWDVKFKLQGAGGNPEYDVYAKIVDTVPGNSDTSGNDLLDSGSGVAGQSPDISPKHLPALYRIEAEGEKAVNPQEKAKLSVLYAY
jgi:hypothetical protein